jgi:hypothetical protein
MLHVADDLRQGILAYLHPARPWSTPASTSRAPDRARDDAEIEGDRWYYYPASGRSEPFHGKALRMPMIVRTVKGMP